MTWFSAIFQNKKSLEEKYFAKVEQAQENAEKEYKSALVIKRAWKNYKNRLLNKKRNEAALLIQCIWRMHAATVKVRVLRSEKYREEREKYFNDMAIKIQKTWRGYFDRKHTFDYDKQRKYLKAVEEKNKEMMLMLNSHYAETNENERKAEFEKEIKKEERKALKEHYLVSTSAIPSVFQSPAINKDVNALPAVEEFIRTVNKAKIFRPGKSPR